MKYIQDDALAELTASLTGCPVSSNLRSNSRMIHGRLEAYTMKRAGTDKQYANTLGNRYTAEQEAMEKDMASQLTKTGRKRSVSTGEAPLAKSASLPKQARTSKGRSNSLDLPPPSVNGTNITRAYSAGSTPMAQSTDVVNRRLLTDLILTLNHSFPDYDFATASSSDFCACSPQAAVDNINKRLSELAVQRNTQNNNSSDCFLTDLWGSVDKVIGLSDVTTVYTYQPTTDAAGDPLAFLKQTLSSSSSNHVDIVVDADYYEREGSGASPRFDGEALWTFNYFFVNKNLKRILLFTCVETIQSYSGRIPEEVKSIPENDVPGRSTSKLFQRRESFMSANSFRSTQSSDDGHGLLSPRRAILQTTEKLGDVDESSDVSVDFDMDPADAVSGGVPIGTV